jgi:sugar lactone lactonase YvrE
MVPSNGIAGFPNDFKVSRISELLQKIQQVDTHDMSRKKCDICKISQRHITAATYCIECMKYLCSGCVLKHDNSALLQKHRKFDLQQVSNLNLMCSKHVMENVQYFCCECRTAICSCCTILGEHAGHEISDLATGVNECKDGLKDRVACLEEKVSEIQQCVHSMDDIEAQVANIFSESTELVKMRTRELTMALRKRETQLLAKLETDYNKSIAHMRQTKDNLDSYHNALRKLFLTTQQLLEGQNEREILKTYKDLSLKINIVLEEHCLDNFGFSDCVNISKFVPARKAIKLGKIENISLSMNANEETSPPPMSLLESCKLIFLCKFTTTNIWTGEQCFPRDVAFLPDSQLVVTDTENNRLQIYDLEGNYVRTIGEGVLKPRAIATTDDGKIIVTDAMDRCVKVYDRWGKRYLQFGDFCCPCGIAIDSMGQYVVTDFFKNTIAVFSSEGRLLAESKLHDNKGVSCYGTCQVAIDRHDNIYVSDIGDNCITKFTSSCEAVAKYKPPHDKAALKGLCIHRDGYVIAADSNNGMLMIIDIENETVHNLLAKRKDLTGPTGVAISDTGLLAVTEPDADTVRLYQLCNKTWVSVGHDARDE